MSELQTEAKQGQVSAVEQTIAEHRAESGVDANAPIERAEVHAAVGEQIQQVMPSYQIPTPASGSAGASWQDPALSVSVQQLVDIAFTKGPQEAIEQAMKSGNPALVDAFHDVMTDELHDELMARKKVDAAS